MINILTRDLESLVVRSDRPQEWLSAISGSTGGTTNEERADGSVRLIFFTAATDRYDGRLGTDDDGGGDISCVAYELEWKDPVAVGTAEYETFVLNRLLVNPDETFEDLLGQTDDANTLDAVFEAAFGNDIDQDRNFVCENIFQFTMVFHIQAVDSSGSLLSQLVSVNPSSGNSVRVKHNELVTDPAQTDLATGTLTAVEVSLTVLTDKAVTQLRERDELANDADWVAKNSYSFTRLIQVPRK